MSLAESLPEILPGSRAESPAESPLVSPDHEPARLPALAPARRIRSRHAEFLPEIQAITEQDHSPAARLLTFAVASIVAAAIAWAALSKVEKVASAPGQVRPAGDVMKVNHPEGGTVAALAVREGQRVVAGETLLTMDAELLGEEIAKVSGRQSKLMAELVRLQAEAEGSVPVFPDDLAQRRPDLVDAQRELFEARKRSLRARATAAERVVEQRRSDVAVFDRRVAQLERSRAILIQQRAATRTLMDKGYFPKLRFLSLERDISELEGQLDEARQGRIGAQAGLAEARGQRDSVDQEWQVEVFDALARTLDEVDANAKLLAQQETRRRATEVRAPASGVVQDIAVRNIGQAVAPNEILMSIVPDSESMVIEARVPDRDIGVIAVGQPATIKVRTYDFIRYGTIEGEVRRIAADATTDPDSKESYFLIEAAAAPGSLEAAKARGLSLSPGMLVDVDLHVGERSILSYLTDRLVATTATAFTEN